MVLTRIKQIAPYTMLIIGGLVLYHSVDQIYYTPMPGQIGPDVWPKILLTLMMLVCVFEIFRIGLAPKKVKISDTSEKDIYDAAEECEENQEYSSLRVIGVIAATTIYLLCLETGGFFLCTIFYTACLMWLGGVRRAFTLISLSLFITFFFTYMFMKIVFVSLPIGVSPFSDVSRSVMIILGIH